MKTVPEPPANAAEQPANIAGLMVVSVLAAVLLAILLPCLVLPTVLAAGVVSPVPRLPGGIMEYHETGSTTMTLTVAPGTPARLSEVRVHLGSASAGNLTVGVDSGLGAAYDATLVQESVSTGSHVAGTDWCYRWSEPGPVLGASDALLMNWANTSAITWGVEVFYSTE